MTPYDNYTFLTVIMKNWRRFVLEYQLKKLIGREKHGCQMKLDIRPVYMHELAS